MGQVYLGESRSGRKVAVKLLNPEFADNPQYREHFAREFEVAQLVDGFHTAQIVDADPDAERPWLASLDPRCTSYSSHTARWLPMR